MRMAEGGAGLLANHLLARPRAALLAAAILTAVILLNDRFAFHVEPTIVLARALIDANALLLTRSGIQEDLAGWTRATRSVEAAIVVRQMVRTSARAQRRVQRVNLRRAALLVGVRRAV